MVEPAVNRISCTVVTECFVMSSILYCNMSFYILFCIPIIALYTNYSLLFAWNCINFYLCLFLHVDSAGRCGQDVCSILYKCNRVWLATAAFRNISCHKFVHHSSGGKSCDGQENPVSKIEETSLVVQWSESLTLIMRSRDRFPILPCEFSLKGRIPAVTMVWVGQLKLGLSRPDSHKPKSSKD